MLKSLLNPVDTAELLTPANSQAPLECPCTEECTERRCYIHTVDHYSHVKKDRNEVIMTTYIVIYVTNLYYVNVMKSGPWKIHSTYSYIQDLLQWPQQGRGWNGDQQSLRR